MLLLSTKGMQYAVTGVRGSIGTWAEVGCAGVGGASAPGLVAVWASVEGDMGTVFSEGDAFFFFGLSSSHFSAWPSSLLGNRGDRVCGLRGRRTTLVLCEREDFGDFVWHSSANAVGEPKCRPLRALTWAAVRGAADTVSNTRSSSKLLSLLICMILKLV